MGLMGVLYAENAEDIFPWYEFENQLFKIWHLPGDNELKVWKITFTIFNNAVCTMKHIPLTHCGLEMPYNAVDLGQYWFT